MPKKSIYVPQYPEQERENVLNFVREHYMLEDVLRHCPNSVTHAFSIPYNIHTYGGHTEIRNGDPLDESEMDTTDNPNADEARREAEYYRNLTDILKESLAIRGRFIQRLIAAWEDENEFSEVLDEFRAFEAEQPVENYDPVESNYMNARARVGEQEEDVSDG